MYYVYLLKSLSFDQIYIGSTKDLRLRLKQHNSGESISTKRFMPWKLVYYEAFESENLARLRERNLKYNGNAVRELKKRIFLSRSGAGYTLIEILVAITVISLIFIFGYAGFRDFSRRQSLRGTAERLKGDLRLAQAKALAGEKPDDSKCNSPNFLNGYRFVVVSPQQYAIRAYCSGGVVGVKTVDLSSDISMSTPSPNPILFKVLGQGTNITGQAIIILTQSVTGNTAIITITQGGEVK